MLQTFTTWLISSLFGISKFLMVVAILVFILDKEKKDAIFIAVFSVWMMLLYIIIA